MTALDRIVADVRARLARRMTEVGMAELLARAEARGPLDPAAAVDALRGDGGVRVIAEVKRVSPALGSLAPIADPGALAAWYAEGGAAAISVLTEPDHFGGSLVDLATVRSRVSVPVLRKDFIVHRYQVAEAAAHGADLILLIVAALAQEDLVELLAEAAGHGLAALVEAHSADEVARAVDAGAQVVGVNNRDLATLRVDPGTFERLAGAIPAGVVRVAESGIRGPDDVRAAAAAGADAVLVGSVLVTSGTPAAAVAELVSAGRTGVRDGH
ncbi:indole-3-glycerol phosphate synthase TrpC [Actinokineospora sp. G85]|uniref:indole-3-glycerol phosphate synthase TrpC n=1 Tax=Actinokineospora sp. G85 TaxID=3406626 RepID=UPI003C70A624